MMERKRCKHCKKLYHPCPRNRKRQKYCPSPPCRQASKRASQSKWLSQPENEDYFRGAENVRRVQQWRERNPDYSQLRKLREQTLQDSLTPEVIEKVKS